MEELNERLKHIERITIKEAKKIAFNAWVKNLCGENASDKLKNAFKELVKAWHEEHDLELD